MKIVPGTKCNNLALEISIGAWWIFRWGQSTDTNYFQKRRSWRLKFSNVFLLVCFVPGTRVRRVTGDVA